MQEVDQECLKMHLYFLKLHMIWPSDTSRPRQFGDFLFVGFFYLTVPIYTLLAIVHLCYIFIDKDGSEDVTEYILVVANLTIFIYTFLIFFWKCNDLVPFVDDLRNFSKFGLPKNLRKLIEKQNRDVRTFYLYTFLSIILYCLHSYYLYGQCEKKNFENGTDTYCQFMIPIWAPRYFVSIYYVKNFIFVVQTVFMLCSFLPFIAGACLVTSVIELITIRVVHLRNLLEDVSSRPTIEEKQESLVHCIKYHVDILRLTNRAVDCCGALNAIHFSLSSVIFGVLNYKMIKSFSLGSLLEFNGWYWATAILCHKGQQLINQSNSLAEDIYALQWLEMDNNFKHYIKLMLLKAQNPMKMKAGILNSYSNEFLLSISRAAYTFLALLNRFEAMQKNQQRN